MRGLVEAPRDPARMAASCALQRSPAAPARLRAAPHRAVVGAALGMSVAVVSTPMILSGGGLVGQTLALALDRRAPVCDRIEARRYAGAGVWRTRLCHRVCIVPDGGRLLGDQLDGWRNRSNNHGHGRQAWARSIFAASAFRPRQARDTDEPLGLMLEARHVRLALDSAVKARPSIHMIQPMSVSAIERDPAGATVTADGKLRRFSRHRWTTFVCARRSRHSYDRQDYR
jgi:2-polyprenyl-6-methoxyphenol hydroxylase-like FAD-dependent oxidoreductase